MCVLGSFSSLQISLQLVPIRTSDNRYLLQLTERTQVGGMKGNLIEQWNPSYRGVRDKWAHRARQLTKVPRETNEFFLRVGKHSQPIPHPHSGSRPVILNSFSGNLSRMFFYRTNIFSTPSERKRKVTPIQNNIVELDDNSGNILGYPTTILVWLLPSSLSTLFRPKNYCSYLVTFLVGTLGGWTGTWGTIHHQT